MLLLIIKIEIFFSLFSPSFVLAFAGTALLRHDWKIRQLTQQLITQNNHIDIATGILTAYIKKLEHYNNQIKFASLNKSLYG
jgi:hypothetical protein